MISIEEYIAWQAKQPNQFGGTIEETWLKQGISDPANNAALRLQAEQAIKTAYARAALNLSYKLPWGDEIPETTVITAGPAVTPVQPPVVQVPVGAAAPVVAPVVSAKPDNKKMIIIVVALVVAALVLSKVFGLI